MACFDLWVLKALLLQCNITKHIMLKVKEYKIWICQLASKITSSEMKSYLLLISILTILIFSFTWTSKEKLENDAILQVIIFTWKYILWIPMG